MMNNDIQKHKAEWKRKGWSIPELRGSKHTWYGTVTELIQSIGTSSVADLDLRPNVASESIELPWRSYVPFLKGIGLVSNRAGVLSLSDDGLTFLKTPSKEFLANLFHEKYRLFGELLDLIASCPKTIEEVDSEICEAYCLDWTNLNNTRRRMDWLEVLDLIQSVGNRKWGATKEGEEILKSWFLISPEVVEDNAIEFDISIPTAPPAINELLFKLHTNPSLHHKRNTYNIWIPSPNRIENLRTIVQFSSEKVSRSDLFRFIENEFNIKSSSVESMMPFMRADGLLEEVGRGVYVATTAAKEWCASGNDLDFIRIIHAHKRFVGEMIAAAEQVVMRNEIYAEGKKHGLNTEKARWIMGFLLEAGLLEETQYLHVKSTPLGLRFITELPLAKEIPEISNTTAYTNSSDNTSIENPECTCESDARFDLLQAAARDPFAEGKASGVAFEEAIESVFDYMGFDVKRIGGSGNTDVVVRWKDNDGKMITAIVDGKSKSNGSVTHSDISDVAIETHKERNDADFVAIVGPGFSGDTIKNHARKKGFALITDLELIDIAKECKALGLSLAEVAIAFKVPNGLAQLNELITTRKRYQEILTLVVSTFRQEQDAMDSLSARDLYFLLRRTDLSPSLEELINAFITLAKEEIGLLVLTKTASSIENNTYVIRGEKHCINRLRALANAIENGLV